MEIVVISDTHGRHREARIPEGDLLLHGGDISNGNSRQVIDFIEWFSALPYTR